MALWTWDMVMMIHHVHVMMYTMWHNQSLDAFVVCDLWLHIVSCYLHSSTWGHFKLLQCTNGAGVCPDATSNQGSTCTNNNFDVYGCVQDGVTCVTYSRLLKTGEKNTVSKPDILCTWCADDTDCDSIFDVTSLDQKTGHWVHEAPLSCDTQSEVVDLEVS